MRITSDFKIRNRKDKGPIFVVGCPRSGTSLFKCPLIELGYESDMNW